LQLRSSGKCSKLMDLWKGDAIDRNAIEIQR
jgi:hypothetical protein